MRVEYGSAEKDGSPDLDADWLADGWVALLRTWLTDAERAGVAEPNAMVVGTVDAAGRPVTRAVLCKSVDETGITFYTNYDSAKGEELAATPYASATFPWFLLGRQVHVRGPVTKVAARADRRLLVQAAARFTAGRVGVAPVEADRVACGAAGTVGRRDRTIRRPRRGAGAAELGWISDRARGRRILAGPGEPGAQQDSRQRRGPHRAAAALEGCEGSSPTPHRCGHRTSGGCGWRASSRSSAPT